MYVLFGTKMFCGPMWSKEPSCQGDRGNTPGSIQDPLKVYMLRRRVVSSKFTNSGKLQVNRLYCVNIFYFNFRRQH